MIDPERLTEIAISVAPNGGFYVEAGANDGLQQSNSLTLEKDHGWTGLLVEPSPTAFRKLRINRPDNTLLNKALVSFEQAGSVISGAFRDGHLMGTLDNSLFERVTDVPDTLFASAKLRAYRLLGRYPRPSMVAVETTALSQALANAGVTSIDFLSLDVEGFELQALAGLDFRKHAPRLVVIEARKRDLWDLLQLFTLNGYVLAENLSRFAERGSTLWTRDHEDFLFVQRTEIAANARLRDVLFT